MKEGKSVPWKADQEGSGDSRGHADLSYDILEKMWNFFLTREAMELVVSNPREKNVYKIEVRLLKQEQYMRTCISKGGGFVSPRLRTIIWMNHEDDEWINSQNQWLCGDPEGQQGGQKYCLEFMRQEAREVKINYPAG
jgi:hypothetical protein